MSASTRSRPRWPDCPGFSLLELVVAIALTGVALALAAPLGRDTLDRWTVRAVRDQALAALHRSRMEARIRGGVVLTFDGDRGVISARTRDSLLWERRDPADASVSMELPDGRRATELVFDRLGLGIVTSRTILFRKGEAEARLVVSSRGRGSRR